MPTATDGDGDTAAKTADITSSFKFLDDGPTVTLTGNSQTVTDDESFLATDNSASFAGLFSPNFGADGAGSPPNPTYALSTAGGTSNLTDTATGQSVVVSQDANGNIVGKTAISGATVFVISVNSATGVVTLDQQRAVVHPNASDPNDSVTLSGTNLVQLTATATDGDGDTAAKTADITSSFKFLDDGPTVTLTGNSQTVTDDESFLATDNSASFAGLFSPNFGADGAGSSPNPTYALSTAGGTSNLTDTATGQSVVVSQDANGNIVGKTAISGATVFVISVNSATGVVTLDQQ